MSQLKSNVTICANCGKPKAPTITTSQAPAFPVPSADALYLMKQFQEYARTLQAHQMTAPPPPPLVPPKEPAPALTINEEQRAPWMAPEPPPLVP